MQKFREALGRQSQTERIETIISTDLLELPVLLCSIIMQQYTLQCTIHRDSSVTLPRAASFPISHLKFQSS